MSRSVAGSYDNEGVSIFALVFCFYMFLKSVNTVICLVAIFVLGIDSLVNTLCTFVFLYGFNVGRIRFYHKYHSNFCIISNDGREVYSETICFLFDFLYNWNILCNAYTFCWVLSHSFQWAYGFSRSIHLYSGYSLELIVI